MDSFLTQAERERERERERGQKEKKNVQNFEIPLGREPKRDKSKARKAEKDERKA